MSLTLHLLVIVPRGVNLSEPCPRRHRAARRPPPAASLWRCDSYLTAVFAGKQIKFTGDVWPQDLSARGASLAPCAHPPCPPGPSGANLYLTVTPGLTAGRWLGGGQRLCVNPASWSRAPDPHVPPHCLVFVMLWMMMTATWNQRDVSRRWSNSSLMLGRRRRRRASIKPALDQRLVFAGISAILQSVRHAFSIPIHGRCDAMFLLPCLTWPFLPIS